MKSLVFHDDAQAELEAAVDYYEQQKKGLGLDLLTEVERATTTIQRSPEVGTPYKATDYRFYVVRRFPYVIYYAALDDCLWIVAVAHGRRRPDYWRRRKPAE